MKTLFIPSIGDMLTLAAPWTFTVHNEHRNETLIRWMGEFKGDKNSRYNHAPLGGGWRDKDKKTIPCTLPQGTELRVDRIYIRKGLDDFDSLTFLLQGAKTTAHTVKRTMVEMRPKPGQEHKLLDPLRPFRSTDPVEYDRIETPYEEKIPARGVRFWAKLADVNKMKIK